MRLVLPACLPACLTRPADWLFGWHSTIIERAYGRGNRNQSLRPRTASPSFSASHRWRLRQFLSVGRKRWTLPRRRLTSLVSSQAPTGMLLLQYLQRERRSRTQGFRQRSGEANCHANETVPPAYGPRTITVPEKMGQPQRSGSPAAAARLGMPLPWCLPVHAVRSAWETSWHRLHDARCRCVLSPSRPRPPQRLHAHSNGSKFPQKQISPYSNSDSNFVDQGGAGCAWVQDQGPSPVTIPPSLGG